MIGQGFSRPFGALPFRKTGVHALRVAAIAGEGDGGSPQGAHKSHGALRNAGFAALGRCLAGFRSVAIAVPDAYPNPYAHAEPVPFAIAVAIAESSAVPDADQFQRLDRLDGDEPWQQLPGAVG